MRREDGKFIFSSTAPLRVAGDDGEAVDDDGDDDDDDDDDKMEVVNLGVADEVEEVEMVDVVLGCSVGVV